MGLDTVDHERLAKTAEYLIHKGYRVSDVFRKRLYNKDSRFEYLSPRHRNHEELIRELESLLHRAKHKKRRTTESHSDNRPTGSQDVLETKTKEQVDKLRNLPMGVLATYMNERTNRKPYQLVDLESVTQASALAPVQWSTANSELKAKVEHFYSQL
eukprot:jgi/Galph1/4508/GphlegSOOS_G3137.1